MILYYCRPSSLFPLSCISSTVISVLGVFHNYFYSYVHCFAQKNNEATLILYIRVCYSACGWEACDVKARSNSIYIYILMHIVKLSCVDIRVILHFAING